MPSASAALRNAFLSALSEPVRAQAEEISDLDNRLAEAIRAARAAWPTVEIAPERFAAYLAERMPADLGTSGIRLEQAADLYLACGCCEGMPAAIMAFESRYLRDLKGALGHLDLGPALSVDVVQIVRAKLLVADGDGPPKIADFSGRGDLGAWVRVIAVRVALAILRRSKKEVALDDADLADSAGAADDPELAHIKSLYREEFRAAFGDALQALTARERNLLRHHFLHGLTIDQIGGLYHVHRATAARWIAKARESLLDSTRRFLVERLRVTPGEFDSIMRLIRSRLDVSLHEFLATPRPGDAGGG